MGDGNKTKNILYSVIAGITIIGTISGVAVSFSQINNNKGEIKDHEERIRPLEMFMAQTVVSVEGIKKDVGRIEKSQTEMNAMQRTILEKLP